MHFEGLDYNDQGTQGHVIVNTVTNTQVAQEVGILLII